MAVAKKKDLKSMVDQQITDMMESEKEPSEGRMKLLTIAIKKLALDAKLEESEFGDFFTEAPDGKSGAAAGGVPSEPKHPARRRANGAGDPADPAAT